jgi:hypothetical protein
MIALVLAANTYLRAFFISRHRLGLEAAALRQQLAVFKRKQSRPRGASEAIAIQKKRSKLRSRAENLFLRKQLALYQERKTKPHRADDSSKESEAQSKGNRYNLVNSCTRCVSGWHQWMPNFIPNRPSLLGLDDSVKRPTSASMVAVR